MPLKRKLVVSDDSSSKRPANVHQLQAQHILASCVIAPEPCDYCFDHFEACAMSSDNSYSKCVACTRLGRPCRHTSSSLHSWKVVVEGQEQLDDEILATESRLDDLQLKTVEVQQELQQKAVEVQQELQRRAVEVQQELQRRTVEVQQELQQKTFEFRQRTAETYAHLQSLRTRRRFLKNRGDTMLSADQSQKQVDVDVNSISSPQQDHLDTSVASMGAVSPSVSSSPDPALALDQAFAAFSPSLDAIFGELRTPGPSPGS
jgi:hypothetical protein